MSGMLNDSNIYSLEALARKHGFSVQQARHINRLGVVRTEINNFLASHREHGSIVIRHHQNHR